MKNARLVGWLMGMALLLLAAGPALAQWEEKIKEDFEPLSGVVIMQVGEEYLIDLDASRGLVPGDLFAVVQPGERIVHPVSGEVLGTLDETKAVLRVTRIKSGYSYAVPVGEGAEIKRGDKIRRYEQTSAAFWDYEGAGEEFQQKLRAALPALEWQDYEAAQSARPAKPGPPLKAGLHLAFVLSGGQLSVLGPGGEVIHTYDAALRQVPAASPGAAPSPPPAVSAPQAAKAAAETRRGIIASVPEVVSGGIIRRQEQYYEGVWNAAELKGSALALAAGDLSGDGRPELAVLFKESLVVGRVEDRTFVAMDEMTFDAMEKSLTLDAIDADGDGRAELYVTAVRNGTESAHPSSRRLVMENGKLRLAEKQIPWFLRGVDWPGEGRILLAQRMGGVNNDFDGPLFRVNLQQDRLVEGRPVEVPSPVSLFGFVPFADQSRGTLFAYLDRTGTLQVLTSNGEVLWQSSSDYGGSEVFFERFDPSAGMSNVPRAVFIKPPLAIGPQGEILVPLNKGWKISDRFRELGPSRLTALQWDGNTLRELWHTQEQQGYMADFQVVDIDHDGQLEVAMTVTYSRPGFTTEGRSGVVVYELQ
ncbi:MAG: hypothetical protein AB7F20_12740 [Geoalkalibacter sp.]|uniref:hypothetical protein n=1 Tax=Geoalkalibacter sp. TaxID=3041440 RepID=UPI003D146FA3